MRCLAALLLLAVAGPCEIIDRIAVTIGHAVITESELLRQIRVTALLNGEQPDFGRISKLDTADRLVEQALIRREMEISKISVDADEPAKQLYAAFRQRFPSEEAYLAALREYNLTDEDVREALHWQATLLQFIELRFEPGIHAGSPRSRR